MGHQAVSAPLKNAYMLRFALATVTCRILIASVHPEMAIFTDFGVGLKF